MVKKKTWEMILVFLFVLLFVGFGLWYYMSFSKQPTPSRGVYVQNNIQSKYGG